MSQNQEVPLYAKTPLSVTTCANCHSAMPGELRFCRNCGFRLGEGVSEYTETVRFGSIQAPGQMNLPVRTPKRRRMSGMGWIFMALVMFFVCAAGFTALVTPSRRTISAPPFTAPVSRSFVGVDGFESTEGGVTFGHTDAPGGPADKAGLVGGDIITTFDGQKINDEDQMMDLLAKTPVGKTVDVVYIRDGETKTTKLTTISKDDFERLNTAFNKRPEGRAQFGYQDSEAQRVQIPNTKLYGVKLNEVIPNQPADLAGIQDGDIVIAFGDVPIRTTGEFLARVKRALPYSTVTLTIMRGDQKMQIPVKMGKQKG